MIAFSIYVFLIHGHIVHLLFHIKHANFTFMQVHYIFIQI